MKKDNDVLSSSDITSSKNNILYNKINNNRLNKNFLNAIYDLWSIIGFSERSPLRKSKSDTRDPLSGLWGEARRPRMGRLGGFWVGGLETPKKPEKMAKNGVFGG